MNNGRFNMQAWRLVLGFICLFLLLPLFANAQQVKGLVLDESDNAIPSASVYIQETKQGIIANSEGVFQLRMPPGIYHLEVRSMGYESESVDLNVDPDKETELTVRLKLKLVSLPEVQITKGEDPAYRIMRKAIEKAPYYQSIVKEAVYETYTKGSGKFLGIPKMMKALSDEEDKEMLDLYMDKLFLQESLSEIHFTAPDIYEQNVKAYSSSLPFLNDPKSALRLGVISLYRPMWGSIISPLNPKAFDYYRFRYEGFEEEDGQYINVIRILPKLKDPKLIEGVIHIADDEWNIRYIDFQERAMGIESNYTMNFNQITDDIYLVTDYRSRLNANILGIRFQVELLSSVQYLDIQRGDSLFFADKEEKKKEKSLEIKQLERKTDVDSLALSRDSLYWSEVRTIVLNDEELQSYQQKDSLKARQDSLSDARNNPKFSPANILTGGTLGNDSSAVYFRYNGLIGGALKEYNFVDGWWLGQSVELDFKKRKNKGLIVQSDVYWGSARKALLWKTDFILNYAPMRLGKAHLSVGRTSEDYSGYAGMDRFQNMLYSLDAGRNYAKLFDSKFIRFSNGIDLANGLYLNLGLELNRDKHVENHTTWNIFGVKNKWTENIPDYPSDLNLSSSRHNYSIGLEYTPEYYYRVHEGEKRYERSRFPTFIVSYKQGFSESLVNDNSVYQQLEFTIQQAFKLNYFSRMNYSLIAGKFFNRNEFSYIDYKHFKTSGPWLGFRSWDNSYALLPYYTFSTNREWIQTFVNYNTDYLLLKRLPFLQGKMITETLQAKFLYTPDKPWYSEWAYSVDLPAGLGGVGVFVGFDSFKYNGVGLQFSFPVFQTVKKERRAGITISI